MNDNIKSGKEILDGFFDNVENIPGVDTKIAHLLKDLYAENKFSHKNISNGLLQLKEDQLND